MAEMVDAVDLKSIVLSELEGSSPSLGIFLPVAQWLEHPSYKREVDGSIPSRWTR